MGGADSMDHHALEFFAATDHGVPWAASFDAKHPDGLVVYDSNCRYRLWSPAMENLSGITSGQCVGQLAFDIFPFLKHTGEDRNIFDALQGGDKTVRDRPYVVASTGRYGLFDAVYGALRNERNEIVGAYGIIHDVTDRYLRGQFGASNRQEAQRSGTHHLMDARIWLKALGLAIKQRRSLMDLSQEEFAFRAGLHRTYITDVERGVRNVSMGSLLKISQALELDVWVITGYTELLAGSLEAEQNFDE